jgi:hypothetical protein
MEISSPPSLRRLMRGLGNVWKDCKSFKVSISQYSVPEPQNMKKRKRTSSKEATSPSGEGEVNDELFMQYLEAVMERVPCY